MGQDYDFFEISYFAKFIILQPKWGESLGWSASLLDLDWRQAAAVATARRTRRN